MDIKQYELNLIWNLLDTEVEPGITARQLAATNLDGSDMVRSVISMCLKEEPDLGEAGRLIALASGALARSKSANTANADKALAANVLQQIEVLRLGRPTAEKIGGDRLM